MEAYNKLLPPAWSHATRWTSWATPSRERYAKSLEIAAKDPNIDGMLVIMTPQGMTNPTQIAEELKPYAHSLGKPVLASWMGGGSVAAGEDILNEAGLPSFYYPDTAVRAFNYMWKYADNLKGLYETPSLQSGDHGPDRDAARKIIGAVHATGPHHPHRVRVEEVAGSLWHSDDQDRDRDHSG